MVPPRTRDGFSHRFEFTPKASLSSREPPTLPATTSRPSATLCMHRGASFCIKTASSIPHHSAPVYCRTSTQLTREHHDGTVSSGHSLLARHVQDIRNMRDGCADCNRNAPTRQPHPLCPASHPLPHFKPCSPTSSTMVGHFLLNEHGEPHFLFHNFKETNLLNNWKQN